MATINGCAAHGEQAENDNAAGRKLEKKRETKKSVGAREEHRRGGFLKVQVQDLSDCQAALSFWFHINAVSFLPPLSSPHLRRCLLLSICWFSSTPLTPKQKPAALQPSVFPILAFALQSSGMKRTPGKVCLEPDYLPVYQSRDHS